MGVSKNQRVGVRSIQRKRYCAQKHELTRVLVVPGFKGRPRLRWMCECDGYTPMIQGKQG